MTFVPNLSEFKRESMSRKPFSASTVLVDEIDPGTEKRKHQFHLLIIPND